MPDNKKRNNTPVDTTYGHLQPQALDVEKIVLGALMIDSEAFSVVSEILVPETFYDPKHQKIYLAIQTLNMAEHPADLITVTEQLRTQGDLETIGGAPYIVDLTSHVASSANIEYYAGILRKKFLARQLIRYAGMIEQGAFDETADVDVLMQEAEGKLFELSQKNMKKDYTQIDPVVEKAVKAIETAYENTGALTGTPSGFEKLDDITSGWQNSDLVIIAGRPAMGKTSFALSIAKNIAVDHQLPVAFFSLEMSNLQLVQRLMSNVCSIDSKKILNGQFSKDDWERLDINLRKLTGAPLYVDDTPNMSVFELRSKARRLVREKDVKLIMIDYLQLMNASGMRFGNRQEEVSTISRSLKGLAKELDIPVLALSQLNRQVDSRDNGDKGEGKRPQLSDLRESGAIEQDADMVLFVHRPEYYRIYEDEHGKDMRGKALIIIAKHRKGATGDVTLDFKGQFTRFENEPVHNKKPVSEGGEVIGSRMNDDTPFPPPEGEIS